MDPKSITEWEFGSQNNLPDVNLAVKTTYRTRIWPANILRRGIIILKREILGIISQIGEGVKKQTKMSEIQIQTICQKCLNYKLLLDPILKKQN